MPRLTSIAIPAAAAALAAGGCGSNNDGGSGTTAAPVQQTTTAATPAPASGATKLALKADPNGALSFDTTTLSAKAGKVTIDLDNPSSSGVPHGIAIEGNGVDQDGKTVQPGGHSTVTVRLKAGTYSYYCPVPGHEAAGMKGTLTVG